MNESTPAAVIAASPSQTSPDPAPRNPAVIRCCQAWQSSIEDSRAKKMDRFDAQDRATAAYRNAMPDLSGYENIRDFVACIGHGMLIGAFDGIEGPKFLYAAQVAIGALRHEPKDQKRPA